MGLPKGAGLEARGKGWKRGACRIMGGTEDGLGARGSGRVGRDESFVSRAQLAPRPESRAKLQSSRGIVITIPPMTSLSLKSRLGLSRWVLWQVTQAFDTARSA